MPLCDIIIPTRGQQHHLSRTLSTLAIQQLPHPWQARLILSYDTPEPGHLSPLPEFSSSWIPPLTITGPSSGAAGARNRALAAASTSTPSSPHIILFLGDDIILRPRALAAHCRFHSHYPDPRAAALGYIRWDPRSNPTPLMEWMVHGGPQNNFDDTLPGYALDPSHFFYGSHVSVKYQLLSSLRFPAYTRYGWEDLDLGRQLAQQHVSLYPLAAARALHAHHYSPPAIIARARLAGRSLVHYQRRYPNTPLAVPTFRTRIRAWIYKYTGLGALARVIFRTLANHYTLPGLFLLVTAAEHWCGYFHTRQWKTKKYKNT